MTSLSIIRSKGNSSTPDLSSMRSLSLSNSSSSTSSATIYVDQSKTITFRNIDQLMWRLQCSSEKLKPRTVKSMLTRITEVFSGEELIDWIMAKQDINEQEAVHFASLLAAHGYIYSIEDHNFRVRNDRNAFYRFQKSFYWPMRYHDSDNLAYATYLYRRSIQSRLRSELTDHEGHQLKTLEETYSSSWKRITTEVKHKLEMEAKLKKSNRKVQDCDERAFWNVYRPLPGSVDVMEWDIRKKKQMLVTSSGKIQAPPCTNHSEARLDANSLKHNIDRLDFRIKRHCWKASRISESLNNQVLQNMPFDPFCYVTEKEFAFPRALHWKISFGNLLKDPNGRDEFRKFLEKEFSAENLDFWIACKKLKSIPREKIPRFVAKIKDQFLCDEPKSFETFDRTRTAINIDSKIKENVLKRMENPNRYCFEEAQDHIYKLMKTDSYARFVKSNQFLSLLHDKKQVQRFDHIISVLKA